MPLPVQVASNSASLGSTTPQSIAAAFPSPVTAGNLIVVSLGAYLGTGNPSVVTVSDTQGSTYSTSTDLNNLSVGGGIQMWYAVAGSSASTTVTIQVTLTGSSFEHDLSIVVAEYAPTGTIALDQDNQNSASNSSPVSTGNITTLSADELLVSAIFDLNGSAGGGWTTASSGWTIEEETTNTAGLSQTLSFADSGVHATGTYSTTFTRVGSGSPGNSFAVIGSFSGFNFGPVISCNSPVRGNLGSPYSHSLTTTSGTPPYTYAITGGSLPAGLSLDTATGAITGTPSGPIGTSAFTVQVTDNLALTNSVGCSIQIDDKLPFIIDPTDLPRLSERFYNAGPFSANAALYTLLNLDSPQKAMMYKSTDGGLIWSAVDSAGAPTLPVQDFGSCAQADKVWVNYVDGSNNIIIRPFDLTTETWGVDSASGPTSSTNGSSAIRSDGVLLVFYTESDILYWASYDTGTDSWLSINNSINPFPATYGAEVNGILVDPTDTAHFFYSFVAPSPTSVASYYYQQLSAAYSLNTQINFFTDTNPGFPDLGGEGLQHRGLQFQGAVIWGTKLVAPFTCFPDGGDPRFTGTTSARIFYFDPYTSTTPTQTVEDAITIPDTSWMEDLTPLVYGSTLRITYNLFVTQASLGPGQLIYIENSGSGWGAPVTIWDAATDPPASPPPLDSGNPSPRFPASVSFGGGAFAYMMDIQVVPSGTQLTAYYLDNLLGPVPSITLSCNSPAAGEVGVAYSHSLLVSGGTPPYTYAITGGALPDGLSLDTSTGQITGTPTLAGVFPFSVDVTDSLSATDSVNCSITITSPPPPPPPGTIRTWLRGTRPGTDKGWMADVYGQPGPICRLGEVTALTSDQTTGVDDKLLGIGGMLYQWAGADSDDGVDITFRIETKADDMGDPRALKLYGDGMLEIVTNRNPTDPLYVTLSTLGDTNTTTLTGPASVANSGTRSFQLTSINRLNRTLGILIQGQSSTGGPSIYGWQPSWVPKPEAFEGRIDDWSDDGKKCNKYLMGCVVEGDTSTSTGTDLVVDGSNPLIVTSATHTFVAADVQTHLVVVSGSGWTPDTYVIVSVAAGAATLDHSPGAVGTTGGIWYLGSPKLFQVQGDGGFVGFSQLVVSHPGQSEFPYSWPPFETHEMRLVPLDTTDVREFGVRWLWDEYPEYSGGIEDFKKFDTPQYVRGFELEASTKGSVVPFQVQKDLGVVVVTPTVQSQIRDILAYGFATPFVASEMRVVPLANWEKFNLRWICDPYPDFAAITTQHLLPFNGRPAFVRGLNIRGDTGNAPVVLQLLKDFGALAYTLPAVTMNGQGITNVPIPAPFVAKILQLVPNGNWRFWEILWDADEYPELTTEQTKVISLGGCRFVQGMRMPADTNNVAVQFEVYGDQSSLQVTTAAQAFNGKTTVAFPIANEWTPFIAHNLFVKPLANARIFTDEIEWISEPAPDLGTGYITPPLTAGFHTWWSMRFFWLAYVSTGVVTCVVTLDGGATETYTWPSSAGLYVRNVILTQPSKSKYRSFAFSSPSPFRLYLQDSYISAKAWASQSGIMPEGLQEIHVFGDRSLDSGARI